MDRLSAMQALTRVIDTGSFSMAARQLGIGQPAISKAIAQLEARLGVKLLVRSTRGLAPTDAGQRFHALAMRALEAADEAEAAARVAGTSLTGRLRISTAVSFGRLHVVPRLPAFMAAHPELEIDIVMDDRPIDIIEEGVDVALRLGPQHDSGLTGRAIASRQRWVVGTPAYFARNGIPDHPRALAAHQAINLSEVGIGAAWTFTRLHEEQTVTLHGRLRVTANEGVREAVLAGLGLTVGAEWSFGLELADGSVRAVLTDWTLPAAPLWAIVPAGRQLSARSRAFIAFIERQLRAPEV